MKTGFTLIELVVVVIIVGILATFAMPQYAKTHEKTLDNEAKATLVLIQAAENIYRSEAGTFYVSSNHDALSSNLSISLPLTADTKKKWNYSTSSSVPTIELCAQATRSGGDNRSWHIWNSTNAPEPGVCQ